MNGESENFSFISGKLGIKISISAPDRTLIIKTAIISGIKSDYTIYIDLQVNNKIHYMQEIILSDSFTGEKKVFTPIDHDIVKIYACGPTVYERPHVGNARAAVVYDMLFRMMKYFYENVVYVRNITDIDDKIIQACKANNIEVLDLTTKITQYYHEDIQLLNCLSPTSEPKATEHIQDMIDMINSLIEKNHAYVNSGHVFFSVQSYAGYGNLSNRLTDEMISGVRIENSPFKKDPMDFVLWKPCSDDDYKYGFESPWGRGRPGWHIECSVMSYCYLGANFDIHGGGADLIFPHHENEIAQSKCANEGSDFANYWVHNGFLTVDGQKMSKSFGNFKTVKELIEEGFEGAVIRYFYFTAHYKKPLDLNQKALSDSKKAMEKISQSLALLQNIQPVVCQHVLDAVADDMNTPLAISYLHELSAKTRDGDQNSAAQLLWSINFLGLKIISQRQHEQVPDEIIAIAKDRLEARKNKNWLLSDLLREKIMEKGYIILDREDSYELTKKD